MANWIARPFLCLESFSCFSWHVISFSDLISQSLDDAGFSALKELPGLSKNYNKSRLLLSILSHDYSIGAVTSFICDINVADTVAAF